MWITMLADDGPYLEGQTVMVREDRARELIARGVALTAPTGPDPHLGETGLAGAVRRAIAEGFADLRAYLDARLPDRCPRETAEGQAQLVEAFRAGIRAGERKERDRPC